MIHVEWLPTSFIDGYWRDIEPLILKPLERTGDIEKYHPKDIRDFLISHDMQCLAVIEGGQIIAVLITQILCYPQSKAFDVFLIGGTGLKKWAK